jgi:hypothetical protein
MVPALITVSLGVSQKALDKMQNWMWDLHLGVGFDVGNQFGFEVRKQFTQFLREHFFLRGLSTKIDLTFPVSVHNP